METTEMMHEVLEVRRSVDLMQLDDPWTRAGLENTLIALILSKVPALGNVAMHSFT